MAHDIRDGLRIEGLHTGTLDQLSFQSVLAGAPFTIRLARVSTQLGAVVHF
jgi:hypothetical protein